MLMCWWACQDPADYQTRLIISVFNLIFEQVWFLFGRWRRQLDAHQNTEPPLTLVPVRLNHTANLGNIQIYSPGGWRIEIPKHDPQSLAEILQRLP